MHVLTLSHQTSHTLDYGKLIQEAKTLDFTLIKPFLLPYQGNKKKVVFQIDHKNIKSASNRGFAYGPNFPQYVHEPIFQAQAH